MEAVKEKKPKRRRSPEKQNSANSPTSIPTAKNIRISEQAKDYISNTSIPTSSVKVPHKSPNQEPTAVGTEKNNASFKPQSASIKPHSLTKPRSSSKNVPIIPNVKASTTSPTPREHGANETGPSKVNFPAEATKTTGSGEEDEVTAINPVQNTLEDPLNFKKKDEEQKLKLKIAREREAYSQKKRNDRKEWEDWSHASTARILENEAIAKNLKEKKKEAERLEFEDMLQRSKHVPPRPAEVPFDYNDFKMKQRQRQEAERQRQEAERQRQEAERQREEANRQDQELERQRKEYERQRQEAVQILNQTIEMSRELELKQMKVVATEFFESSPAEPLPYAETLSWKDGIVNIALLSPNQHLDITVIDAYLEILRDEIPNKKDGSKHKILASTMLFQPLILETKMNALGKSEVDKTTGPWMVKCQVLDDIKNSKEDIIFSLLQYKKEWICLKLQKTNRVLEVLTEKGEKCSPQLHDGMKLLAEATTKSFDSVVPWNIKYKKPLLLCTKNKCDSGVAALLEVETSITGRVPIGVTNLNDFRQKLKWKIIEKSTTESTAIPQVYETNAPANKPSTNPTPDTPVEAATDDNAIVKKVKEYEQEIERLRTELASRDENGESQHLFWQKIEQSKDIESILDAAGLLKLTERGIECMVCKDFPYFRPISVNRVPDTGWSQLKSKIKDHLKSESHMTKCREKKVKQNPFTAPSTSPLLKMTTVHQVIESLQNFERQDTALVCLKCYDGKTRGKFQIPSHSQHTEDNSRMTKPFHNFRQSIAAHLDSVSHKNATDNTTNPLNYDAGMNIARNAYYVVKMKKGFTEFSNLVSADAAKQVQVGNINHSPAFPAEMLPIFANILRQKLKSMLHTPIPSTGRMPPVSFIADKFTPNRTTLHIVGLIFPYKGQLRSYLLATLPAKDYTGRGLAEEIVSTLRYYLTDDEIRAQVTGGCFDGQYIKLNVPKHIQDILQIPEEVREAYTFIWDPAHLLELSGKDARKQGATVNSIKVKWVQTTISIVNELGSQFKWGKQLKELTEQFELLKLNKDDHVDGLKKFQLFSTTRFTSYLYNFLKCFSDNYPVVYSELVRKDDDILQKISNPDFVLQLSFLVDIYREIQLASKILQTVNILPWHVKQAVQSLISTLSDMKTTLNVDVGDFWPMNLKLESFNHCTSELLSFGSFKGRAITGNRNHRTRSSEDQSNQGAEEIIDKMRPKLVEHLDDFIASITKRFTDQENTILEHIRTCFSISEIMNASGSTPASLEYLYSLYKKAGFIDDSCTYLELEKQYRRFTTEVRSHFENEVSLSDETTFYMQLLSTTNAEYPKLLQVIANSCARNCCESVTEGMGSQVGFIVQGRGNLSSKNLNDEAFIVHNGPNPGPECNPLLEEAMRIKFSGSNWHFNTVGTSSYRVSKVVDRNHQPVDKIDLYTD